MYDIKIYLEKNGKFGASVKAGKEILYTVGSNQDELMTNIKNGLECSFDLKNRSPNISRLFSFFNNTNKKKYAIKV